MKNKMLKLSVFGLFVVLMASFVAAENMGCDVKDILSQGEAKVYTIAEREYEMAQELPGHCRSAEAVP